LSIFPVSVHQFYANIFVFVNINRFLYINDQFALVNIVPHSSELTGNISLRALHRWEILPRNSSECRHDIHQYPS
jgi:hypothetical protein